MTNAITATTTLPHTWDLPSSVNLKGKPTFVTADKYTDGERCYIAHRVPSSDNIAYGDTPEAALFMLDQIEGAANA